MSVQSEVKQIKELADWLMQEPDCVLYAHELLQHAQSLYAIVRGPSAFTYAHAAQMQEAGALG
jgi:hypothetical protein